MVILFFSRLTHVLSDIFEEGGFNSPPPTTTWLLTCHLLLHFLDFVPIDLDEWWAQRFLANIDKLSWCSSGICGSCRLDEEMGPEAVLAHRGLGRRCIGSKWDSVGWTVLGRYHRNHREWLTGTQHLSAPSVTDTGRWRTSWNWHFSHPTPPKKDVMLLWNAVNWYFQEALYLHIFIWQRNDLCTPFLMHFSFIARKPVEKKFDHWQWISYIHPTFKIFSVQETTNIKIKWWRKKLDILEGL